MTKGPNVSETYPPAFVRKSVGDLKVVSDVVYASPLSRPGHMVPIHGIRTLTLSDGSVVYGCRHCDFTGPGPGKVRGHRRVEQCGGISEAGTAPRPPRREGGAGQVAAPSPGALDMPLRDLVDLANQLDALYEAQENLDAENRSLREKLTEEKQAHREEVAEIRREHRGELRESRDGQKAAEKELAGFKARLGKLIGTEEG
jgi:regulator of replication initiation timing